MIAGEVNSGEKRTTDTRRKQEAASPHSGREAPPEARSQTSEPAKDPGHSLTDPVQTDTGTVRRERVFRMSAEDQDREAAKLFGSTVQGVYDRFSKALDDAGVPSRYYGFNGGGAATTKQKNYLRALLRQNAGTKTAEAIRDYFNCRRMIDEPISFGDVTESIQALKKL